jgi:hypothetical protein
MDNIILNKYMQDTDVIGLDVLATSKYVSVKQYCYVDKFMLENAKNKILDFVTNLNDCYIEFGDKSGNCTPAFSMGIRKKDSIGHVQIELDLEIDDNQERKHRCQFYIYSNIGEIEQFGKRLMNLISNDIDTEISLVNSQF